MLPDAGTLRISLACEGGAVRAAVVPPPALPLARLLAGMRAEEAARMASLVHAICGAAQEAAARSALGLPQVPGARARIGAETLREHVLKLAALWPGVVGEAGDRQAVALANRASSGTSGAAPALAEALFAPLRRAPADWAELETYMAAGASAPARAMARVAREWDASWGRVELAPFDPQAPVDWASATQAGRPVENTPATRHADAPLLAAIAARHGRGILWRMAARLVEVGALLAGAAPPPVVARGIANAARGAMLVEAHAPQGTVTVFRRLSPTDFALAEGGVLARALATLPAARGAPLGAVARMVVETVDPCLATRLEVSDA